MKYVYIDDIKISTIVMGECAVSENREFAFRAFDTFLDNGGNCFDTARSYGGGASELALGDYLKTKQRDKIVVVTKCVFPGLYTDYPRPRLDEKNANDDLENSLRALKTDYIDFLLLHRDDIAQSVEQIMPWVDRLVKSGKVRKVGVSNWTAGRIVEANAFAQQNNLTQFSVSQIQWSLALTTPAASGDFTHVIMDDVEYSWYEEQKFPVMAWTSTAKGFYSKLARGLELTDKQKARYGWLSENFRRGDRIIKLSKELNVSVGSLALAYITSAPLPAMAVTSFSNMTQLAEALTEVELTLQQRSFLGSFR